MGTEWRAATAAKERLELEERGEEMSAAKAVPADEPNCCTQPEVEQQKQRRLAFDEMTLLLPGGAIESKTAANRNASAKGRAEAREVFLRMQPNARVSRSLRAEWLLNHLNGTVQLTEEEQKSFSIFGILRSTAKLGKEEQPRIGPGTAITFMANCYRLVFVLDLSPSCFVIDDLGCVLYSRLIQNLLKCLRSLVAKAIIPGAQCEFRPRILVSVCAFSPFLCFPEENILLQAVLLCPETIESLIDQLQGRLKQYIDRLIRFTQPHMRQWSAAERQRRRRTAQRQAESAAPLALAKQDSNTDRGFINSDWALIFMLRMGLMSVQMMSESARSLANIVLVTDGVCGVFDQQSLQGVLNQLRLHAIACSFVQLRVASLRGPVLGHVGFPELFSFIATATFGAALSENDLEGTKGTDGMNSVQRALLTWSFRKGLAGQSSVGQLAGMPFSANNIRNKRFTKIHEGNLGRLLAIRLREGFSIKQLDELPSSSRADEKDQPSNLMIRLSLAWRPQITVEYSICCPRPNRDFQQHQLERKIKLHVEVFVEAQASHCSVANLLGERHDPGSLRSALLGLNEGDTLLMHLNSFGSDSHYWDVPKEVDRSVALFELRRTGGTGFGTQSQQQQLVLAERYEPLRNSKFFSYWQPLSYIDEGIWQKWMHTHAIRLLLAHDQPLPERIFTAQSKGRFVQCSAELAWNELQNHLKRWANFSLVRDQTYVCLLYEGQFESRTKKSSGSSKMPDNFCLIRVSLDIPCALLRLCFSPGVSGKTRDEVLKHFIESLGRLRIASEINFLQLFGHSEKSGQQLFAKNMEVPALSIIQKPFERLLVRYKAVPHDLNRIVRLESTESTVEKRDMIVHNAVAKFLCCRRQVWRMRGILLKNTMPSLSALEFMLQTLLRLRLRQGFRLAWSRNGIVNLIRQVPAEVLGTDCQQPVIEQCAIFGPTMGEHLGGKALCSRLMRKASPCDNENIQQINNNCANANDKYGTLESAKCEPMMMGCWPQIITEIWSEPGKQSCCEPKGIELSRQNLLAENALLIRTLFTFDQLMAVSNTRLWADKPFVLEQEQPATTAQCPEDTQMVHFFDGVFDLTALLQNATQRELMLLPAMGYAECDPHSLTRLSFLLKGVQQELAEFCDVCVEVSDGSFFADILHQLGQCLGEGNMPDKDFVSWEEDDTEEEALEAELAEVWRRNLPPLREPVPERLTLPARPPPASSPPSPLPIGSRHFSLGGQRAQRLGGQPPACSIPNSPTPKSAGLKTSFLLPTDENEQKQQQQQQQQHSRNLFSESADARHSTNQPMLETSQQQHPLLNPALAEQQYQQELLISAAQRSTSVPLLWGTPGGKISPLKAKAGGNKPLKSTGRASANIRTDGISQLTTQKCFQQQKLQHQQKRASISAHNQATMLSIDEPKKKLSAPATGLTHATSKFTQQQEKLHHQKNQHQNQRVLKLYAKRLNDWRLLLFVMAKDARVCRGLMPSSVPNTFPVLAFFCDKPRMCQHLVENTDHGQLPSSQPWIVENFAAKTGLSALAHLQQQVQRREELGNTGLMLDSFFLAGSYAAANAGLMETDLVELTNHYLPAFDLIDHCENVFEEFLFTKAYIGAVYACLGQQLFVPPLVLLDALDFRCEQTNVQIGPINDILKDTCSHLGHPKIAQENEQKSRPAKRRRQLSTASTCSVTSDASFSTASIDIGGSPSKQLQVRDIPSSTGTGRSSGEETLVMGEHNISSDQKTTSTMEDCRNQLDDFRAAFEQLLRRHNFHRIPGLSDYFFYWPEQQEQHSLSTFNLPSFEEYIQITLPTEFSPPASAHFSQAEAKTSAFSRHSSARNTGKEKSAPGNRVRKPSASCASVAERRRATTVDKEMAEDQLAEQGSIQSRDGSSSASWEQQQDDDGEEEESEKSSLAGELLCTERWPLFIQFYVAIQTPSGQKHCSPMGFIPNCMKQIFEYCPVRVKVNSSGNGLQFGEIQVNIDMSVLTWPLPSHCPYGDQSDEELSTEHGGLSMDEDKDRVRNLEELFGDSDGGDWIQLVTTGNSDDMKRQQSGKWVPPHNQQNSGDEIFERKVEMLRQIPAEERRLLRRLQRNVQKMLKTEHVLITSRSFEAHRDTATLLRVMQFIREEVNGRGAANARNGTEQTVARFEMCNKELVLVTDSEDGLRRLAKKLDGLQVDYCRLRQLPLPPVGFNVPFELESLMNASKMLFYNCGVDDLNHFVRSRHESIRQVGSNFKRILADESSLNKSKIKGETKGNFFTNEGIRFGETSGEEEEEENEEEDEEETGLIEEGDEDGQEPAEGELFCNSSTTADDGTIAELTMPLNDGDNTKQSLLSQVAKDLAMQHRQANKDLTPRNGIEERKQLLHDFWLAVQVEEGNSSNETLSVNIYFCQRTFLVHDQLFESACRLVDEQIRLVNQELLLERMHQTEECDPLLLDHDVFLKGHHQQQQGVGIGLDSVPQGSAATRSVQNVPGEARHASKFAQNRPSSLLLEMEQSAKYARNGAIPNVSAIAAAAHIRNNSLTFSDEEEHSELSELARYKFRPGHFACELVWHHWFHIHPRLQPSRAFGSSGNDIGFKALRLGLEGLAVRNRSNFYVYKEQNGNVVYMRLHCTEESVLANIPGPRIWEEEVRQHCPHSILLAVHGVRPPGEEITVQLRSVLQRRLNSRTLEEIQNALLKNAHIRLEWSDIRFIQRDPAKPCSVFFFTLPQLVQHHLGSIKYYLSQQMLTFCISPKFREQSGVTAHQGRGKYSSNSRYFSGGGGNSLALSLAGTPTIEQQPQQFRIVGTDQKETIPHTFVPYTMPKAPGNPPNYVPTFLLVNKPPGEGKRDTGIACLELKLIDWQGTVLESTEEGRLDADSHSLLYPGCSASVIDPLQRAARLHELSRCVQVENPLECTAVPGTCALFQFNMWQNGNVGIEELQGRLKMCVQQAICDLVTEFGLLSNSLFESYPTSIRSKAGSFSVTAPTSLGIQSASALKPCSSELPIPQCVEETAPNGGSSAPLQSPVKALVGQQSDPIRPLAYSNKPADVLQQPSQPAPLHSHPLRHPMTMPLLNRGTPQPLAGRQLQSPTQFANAPQQTAQQKQQQLQEGVNEYLRADFVQAADEWFSHVIDETKGSPEISHSAVRKFQFHLDSDASARKIVQVIDERLKSLLKTERIVICRNTATMQQEAPVRKRLQTLHSSNSLLDPVENPARDLGRPVNNQCDHAELLELALLAFNEQLGHETIRTAGQPHEGGNAPISGNQIVGGSGAILPNLPDATCPAERPEGRRATMVQQRCRPAESSGQSGCIMDEEEEMRIWRNSMEPMQAFSRRMSCVSSLGCWRSGAAANHHLMRTGTPTPAADQGGPPLPMSGLSKFLPCLKPFIPRQRLLYLLIRGEHVHLFLYNYTNEVMAKAREIVERATLWHNARSRLLREIGLHKMGITHLSTLKSADAKYNSYLLLTWMDPETLVNNDYPVDSLTTPDFTNIPRIYAQLLLKLYRFADPAFMAKHISPNPFEDQTQQMLALREDVRTMLNDHRLYMEAHQQLQTDPEGCHLSEEVLTRLVSHCHQVHFVQTPLLLFPSWRHRIATIRMGAADPTRGMQCRKHSFQSMHHVKANKNPFPVGTTSPNHHPCLALTLMEEEPCSGRIQQMLLEEYANYLRSVGLSLLHVEPEVAITVHTHQRHPTGTAAFSSPAASGHHHQHPQQRSPEQWLCCAQEGGIIFLHLSFMVPYFCLRVLQWNAHPQLDEHLRPNQQRRPSCAKQVDQQQHLRLLEHSKNELVRRCHLHSFVYDFHLRMVARYLVGAGQVLFNPGYNINAFLLDFLQYYGCRPPSARNCVYEETIHCPDLQVNQFAIWEHFLNNEQHFGWKVVRLKSIDAGGNHQQQQMPDEFMLVTKEKRNAFGLDYELIRVVVNPCAKQTSQQPRIGGHEHQITLRLYVLLVNATNAPYQSGTANSTADLPPNCASAAGGLEGGEFVTQFMVGSKGGLGNLEQQQLSPCSTLVEQRETATAEGIDLPESSGEEEADADREFGIPEEFRETRVMDHEESLLPPLHHRQASANSTCSQQSYGQKSNILPLQLSQPNNYCYECVIAAAADLSLNSRTVEARRSGRGASQRQRFCSGGVLLSGPGRRMVAARMSLPPSRSSTNSSSSMQQMQMQKEQKRLQRQRSDSSQLSASPSTISPTKKETDAATTLTTLALTPATSLKGLSEWRAAVAAKNTQNGQQKTDECDWTLFEEPATNARNGQQKLAIQRNPPRRHRKGNSSGQQEGNPFCMATLGDQTGRETGTVVPPEQVTYLHYLSSHQRRLQQLLELEVRANRLSQFIAEADRFCYVDSLWKALLALRPFQLPSQKGQSMFLSSTSSKSDMFTEANIFSRHSIPHSSDSMESYDFEALLRVISIEPVVEKEPRVTELLQRVNWQRMCRFLVHFYEDGRRCRYFENSPFSYLVITNPQFLDSAAMFRHDFSTGTVELFLIFKQQSTNCISFNADSFAGNSVRKLLEEVISCLCTFHWTNLLQNPPSLG